METWEKELRDKLELQVKNGCYNIGTEDFVCLTGKGGYINFQVEFARQLRENIGMNIKPTNKVIYPEVTEEQIKEYMNELWKMKQ